jgi:hypothetical protein
MSSGTGLQVLVEELVCGADIFGVSVCWSVVMWATDAAKLPDTAEDVYRLGCDFWADPVPAQDPDYIGLGHAFLTLTVAAIRRRHEVDEPQAGPPAGLR